MWIVGGGGHVQPSGEERRKGKEKGYRDTQVTHSLNSLTQLTQLTVTFTFTSSHLIRKVDSATPWQVPSERVLFRGVFCFFVVVCLLRGRPETVVQGGLIGSGRLTAPVAPLHCDVGVLAPDEAVKGRLTVTVSNTQVSELRVGLVSLLCLEAGLQV